MGCFDINTTSLLLAPTGTAFSKEDRTPPSYQSDRKNVEYPVHRSSEDSDVGVHNDSPNIASRCCSKNCKVQQPWAGYWKAEVKAKGLTYEGSLDRRLDYTCPLLRTPIMPPSWTASAPFRVGQSFSQGPVSPVFRGHGRSLLFSHQSTWPWLRWWNTLFSCSR